MQTRKLASTDGFVVVDLEGAEHALGVVRCAPKILVDGATMLARSVTYEFACFERKVSGASAGINAKPPDREAAIAAFVEELTPGVASGALSIDAAKGVAPNELDAFTAVDSRTEIARSAGAALTAASMVTAADVATGGLAGRSAAIEGFDDRFAALARRIVEAGGRLAAISTASGTAYDHEGFDPVVLADRFGHEGPGFVTTLPNTHEEPSAVLGAPVDVLFAGSKAGVIEHESASTVQAKVVVPSGRVPVTAKALAVLRRAGCTVVPDFVSLAGPGLVAWPDGGAEPNAEPTLEPAMTEIDRKVRTVLDEAQAHDEGMFMGACIRAEQFLRTWQDSLPFGRPLA
jgi:glutamate dehydrogenase/leucine dehydrogenase